MKREEGDLNAAEVSKHQDYQQIWHFWALVILSNDSSCVSLPWVSEKEQRWRGPQHRHPASLGLLKANGLCTVLELQCSFPV